MTLGRDWSRPLGASGSRGGGGGTVSWSVWDYLGLGIGAGCGTECPFITAGPCRLGHLVRWRFWRGARELSRGPQSNDRQYLLTWRKLTGEKDVRSWHPFFPTGWQF